MTVDTPIISMQSAYNFFVVSEDTFLTMYIYIYIYIERERERERERESLYSDDCTCVHILKTVRATSLFLS